MPYFRLLLVFSFEVIGIALLGFVAYEKLDLPGTWVGSGIAVLLLAVFAKFLYMFSKWK